MAAKTYQSLNVRAFRILYRMLFFGSITKFHNNVIIAK